MKKIFLLILVSLFGQNYAMAEESEKNQTEKTKDDTQEDDQHDKNNTSDAQA